jgi:hypothetical protein
VPRPKTRVLGSECKRGHPLIGDNVYVAPDGHFQCRRCRADRQEATRLRNQAIRQAIAKAQTEESLASPPPANRT